MAEIQKTNICCLDLSHECIDYLKSLNLNVYEGSLGSVFSIKWGRNIYETKPLLIDVDYPANLHEYHVFIHDMEHVKTREYKPEEHNIREVESEKIRRLECHYPVNTLDLRPFGLSRLNNQFREMSGRKRIEIVFVGRENEVTYFSNTISQNKLQTIGPISNIDNWHLVSGVDKYGERVKLEDNWISKTLFGGRDTHTRYYRVFSLPTEIKDNKRVIDSHFISLLNNEAGECVSYVYSYTDSFTKFIFPQVEDKKGLLKDLFENIIFVYLSDYFPDIEARNWIHNDDYLLPDELDIREKIESKREEFEQEIKKLQEEEAATREKNIYLKHLVTETGDPLVKAVKTYLEWLGFENVIDKDETLEDGDLKEEDLCLDYEGTHVLLEVKGINGTSTDGECSQVDKIVTRRMRQLKTTEVHGVYIVNNQKNVELLKRQSPPFNDIQQKDAVDQSRTMIYTAQLFALYSDIENGYILKEDARRCFLQPGLVDFHLGFTSIGVPYNYYQNDTVICLELKGNQITVGDVLYYKDKLNRLVGCTVESIEQDKQPVDEAFSGNVGIKVNVKVPRNRELFKKLYPAE